MTEQPYTQPSDVALAHLRRRIGEDTTLSEEVKTAVLADLQSEEPRLLRNLIKHFSEKETHDANHEDKGK